MRPSQRAARRRRTLCGLGRQWSEGAQPNLGGRGFAFSVAAWLRLRRAGAGRARAAGHPPLCKKHVKKITTTETNPQSTQEEPACDQTATERQRPLTLLQELGSFSYCCFAPPPPLSRALSSPLLLALGSGSVELSFFSLKCSTLKAAAAEGSGGCRHLRLKNCYKKYLSNRASTSWRPCQ